MVKESRIEIGCSSSVVTKGSVQNVLVYGNIKLLRRIILQ